MRVYDYRPYFGRRERKSIGDTEKNSCNNLLIITRLDNKRSVIGYGCDDFRLLFECLFQDTCELNLCRHIGLTATFNTNDLTAREDAFELIDEGIEKGSEKTLTT